MLGMMQTVVACPECHGDGTIIKDRCADCQGEGRRESREPLSVKIPAGINHGQKIKLTGQGEAGRRGTPAGDLFLEISVASDPKFTRDDVDILSESEVSMSMAALGGSIDVLTLDGQETLKIPSGIQSGTVLTIKGRGVPHLRGRGRGDQRVTIRVATPEKVSGKAKKLFQQLQDEGY
jgi:molecular chaperone DnaJ